MRKKEERNDVWFMCSIALRTINELHICCTDVFKCLWMNVEINFTTLLEIIFLKAWDFFLWSKAKGIWMFQ